MGKFRKSRGRDRSLGKKRTLRGGAGEETTPDPRSLALEDMVIMYVEKHKNERGNMRLKTFENLVRDKLKRIVENGYLEWVHEEERYRPNPRRKARRAKLLALQQQQQQQKDKEVADLEDRLLYEIDAAVGGKSRTKRRRTRTKRRKSRAKRRRTRH